MRLSVCPAPDAPDAVDQATLEQWQDVVAAQEHAASDTLAAPNDAESEEAGSFVIPALVS